MTLMLVAKRFISILGLLLIMVPFQNCSIQSGIKNLNLSSNAKSESGNGGGYEGKPDGTYYHFIPNFTCAGKPAAEQITEIKNGQAYLYGSQNGQCGDQSTPIAANDINLSPFQNDFISVKDSLFKRYDEKPDGIPNNIAEILCRDNFDEPTFEIVSHYDREKNEALSRVYFSDRQISDFSVSRILSSSEVHYVSSSVSFKVDMSKPAFPDRKFSGAIERSTISGLKAQPLVCVIGGSIDTSKWNLKTLTTIDVGGFQLLKNNEIMFWSEVSRTYFAPTYYNYVTHIFKIGLDNVVSDFSKMVLGESYNVIGTIESPDDNLSVFQAKLPSEMWPSMFVYNSKTGKTKKLTNLTVGAEPEAYFLMNPSLTADQYFIFDTDIIHANGNRTGVVRVYNFNDETISDIGQLDHATTSYSVLPESNKVLLYWVEKNGVKNVIEVFDAKSKISKDLVIQIPTNCLISGVHAKNVKHESAVIVLKVCDGSQKSVIQVSLVDGSTQLLGSDSFVTWASDDNNRIVMTNSANQNSAYDTRTGKVIALPIDPNFGDGVTDFILSAQRSRMALIDDRWLYGFGGKTSAPTMYQIDLQSGAQAPICEGALGKKLFLGMLPDQKVFLFTYDAAVQVYRFYQVKGTSDCARLNEFPSQYPNVPKMIPTKIGFGLLLGNPLSASSSAWTREAVFVPIDGRPPLKFNPTAIGNWRMEVSPDKNRIVLSGPGSDNLIKIFSFDL
ncbi:MAG: hypothetical protein H7256_09225 [Bdellovibrio sp.]|nr:hypothetical protein [Bdellovibrio sp.]